MGRIIKKKYNLIDTTLDRLKRECNGRFSLSQSYRTLGIWPKTGTFQHGCVRVCHISNLRRLCLKEYSTATTLHVLAPRQLSSRARCDASSLGQSIVSIPSSPYVTESPTKDSAGENFSHPNMPEMALRPLVAPLRRNAGGSSPPPPSLQGCSGQGTSGLPAPLLRPISGGASEIPIMPPINASLDNDDLQFLSKHLASGTATNYKGAFAQFNHFCKKYLTSPFSCSPDIIVKYIRHMFEKGSGYSTINLHHSAISKNHVGFSGQPIGSHPLVRQALKSVFRQRPPLPKYTHTFNIEPVLKFLSTPNTQLTLKQLTMKTLLLTIYSSLSRVSSINRLGPAVTKHQDHIILHLQSLEKQSRPNNIRGFIPIPYFEEPHICPARTIIDYVNKVKFLHWLLPFC